MRTRPERIEIPGMNNGRGMTARWMSAMTPARRRAPAEDVVFHNSDGSVKRRPALQGYACLYNVAFEKDGNIQVFVDGCFTESVAASSQGKGLWLDHDPNRVVGTSDDGLTFEQTLDGLAFRFPLEGNARAGEIRSHIDKASKACVSVGCRIQDEEVRDIAGHRVTFITRAALEEVSLVGQGAVPGTFATLVDLDDWDDSLWLAARTARFRADAVASNVSTAVARITEKLRSLA